MANDCCYDMKICGSENDVEAFVPYITGNCRIGRIFSGAVYDIENYVNGKVAYYVCGDCAWSVATAMNDYGLIELTKKHNVAVEVYSKEPGVGFQEHYVISCGELITDEETEYDEWWFDDNDDLAEFAGIHNVSLEYVEEMRETFGYFPRGGFPNYCDFQDLTTYL